MAGPAHSNALRSLDVDEVLQMLLHALQLAVVDRVGGVDQRDLLLVHPANIEVLGSQRLSLRASWSPPHMPSEEGWSCPLTSVIT